MGGGCEVERGEISDKSCLSYFVIRSNVYKTLCPGSQFGGRRRSNLPCIAHQRDDDIQGENEADWRRNAITNYGCDGFVKSFLRTRHLSPNTSGSETGMGLEARTFVISALDCHG